MLYIGDVLAQLFIIAVPITISVIIILSFRTSKKHKEQLNRIEEKLDELLEQRPS